jgi:hypothetical protein
MKIHSKVIFLLKKVCLFLSVMSFFQQGLWAASANEWEKVTVPDVRCGAGGAYHVFIRKGDPQKVAFGFSGGGACWDYDSCFGLIRYTSLQTVGSVSLNSGIYAKNPAFSALSDYTHVYFPYCTGDVFLADHTAVYRGRKVYHEGRSLVRKSIEHLDRERIVGFSQIEQIALFGHSAGAISALYHITSFDPYVKQAKQKIVISDGPGMHFGKTFWKKFSKDLIHDYTDSLAEMGLVLDVNDGHVAKQIQSLCQKFPDWRIGILQSTKDFVMSRVFGEISQSQHAQLVLGPEGIAALTADENDNCSSWVPHTATHTFLSDHADAQERIGAMSAINFANEIVTKMSGISYRAQVPSVEREESQTY